MIILEYILVHQLILWVDSPGDKVVQGSVVAGDIETPSDAMGVVAGPSSGFGIAPALRSKSPSHFNPDDGSYHGGQNLADLNEKEDPPPMIDQQPVLEQLDVGIVGNAVLLLEATFQLFP